MAASMLYLLRKGKNGLYDDSEITSDATPTIGSEYTGPGGQVCFYLGFKVELEPNIAEWARLPSRTVGVTVTPSVPGGQSINLKKIILKH